MEGDLVGQCPMAMHIAISINSNFVGHSLFSSFFFSFFFKLTGGQLTIHYHRSKAMVWLVMGNALEPTKCGSRKLLQICVSLKAEHRKHFFQPKLICRQFWVEAK